MGSHVTVEDWKAVEGSYVVAVTIHRTDAAPYPSGWNCSLHFGEIGGDTILRYDNAHEDTKGHERHTRDDVKEIDFPGMLALYDRFIKEVEANSPVTWDWPARS
jgi:hypothetical protein